MRSPKARSGPGCRTAAHAASTSTERAWTLPRLEMRPWRAVSAPDWRTLGSSPRYATSWRGVAKREMSPIAPIREAATAAPTPGLVQSPRACTAEATPTARVRAVARLYSLIEKVDLAQTAGDRLRLLVTELMSLDPGPSVLAEQVADGGPAQQAARERSVDIVLGADALAPERGATSNAAAQRLCRCVWDPDLGEHPCRQQLGQRARVETVALHARVRDGAHLLGVGDNHTRSVRLKDAGDLHRRPARLERHLIA